IPDIHGGYEELVSLLINGGIMESGGNLGDPGVFSVKGEVFTYTGGNTLLVFLGDLIDKGAYADKVILLAGALELQTDVIALWGNHEADLFQARYVYDQNPSYYGLESTAITLKQFGYTDEQIVIFMAAFFKDTSPDTPLSELLEEGPVEVMYAENPEATEYIKWLQKNPVIAKIILANGERCLVMHAGLTRNALDAIKASPGTDIWSKFSNAVLTSPEVFSSIVKAWPEEWINDAVLLEEILTLFEVDKIMVGHANRAGWQKLPNQLKLVGAEVIVGEAVYPQKVVYALDNLTMAKAAGGYAVECRGLIHDGVSYSVAVSDEFPSPIIQSPESFDFKAGDPSGKVYVRGGGRTVLIHRATFNDWYCADAKWNYVFSNYKGDPMGQINVNLNLGQLIEITFFEDAVTKKFALPCAVLDLDVISSGYYFVASGDKVTMYYKNIELGYAEFSLEAGGEDLWIKELVTYHAALSQTVYEGSEAARALIINAYKLSSETIKRIIFADSLLMVDDPALSAYESLGPDGNGYLGILKFDIDYADCKAVNVLETGMERAIYAIMPEAAPIVNGNTKLVFEADDPADPSDSGPVTIINIDPGTGAIIKTTIERPLFRQWYCDTLAKLTIKGVTLDLSDKVEVPMHLGDVVYSLRPEFAINFNDVSASAVFVQTPSSVESYYKMSVEPTTATGMKTGRVEFHLSADNSEILIDDITVADGLYKLIEKNMVQSLLLAAIKAVESRNGQGIESIGVLASLLTEPVLEALSDFVKKGLLLAPYGDDLYRFYNVKPNAFQRHYYTTPRGKMVSYSRELYDGSMTDDDEVSAWWPKDAEGNFIDNPLNPGNPLYIFLDGKFQGDEMIFDFHSEMFEFNVGGLDFVMPLWVFSDRFPSSSHAGFSFGDVEG
ncbi:MAG: metallophosphoesterase, partial [Candidatus Aureabacteria bacterium]|nr:metallophosphoesterase [Candidatus Auribacterota bacterium]